MEGGSGGGKGSPKKVVDTMRKSMIRPVFLLADIVSVTSLIGISGENIYDIVLSFSRMFVFARSLGIYVCVFTITLPLDGGHL